jgi:hypothetical protein
MSDIATREDVVSLGQTVEAMTAAVNAQTAVMQDLARALGEQRHIESARATGGRVEMHISAGSLAAWIAGTFCAIAMTAVLCLGGAVLWLAIRTNDHGHQMNAVYQSVPGLRELVAEQMKLNQSARGTATEQEPAE